jgi:transcriptional regulator with XRE-family HTH domain
MLPPLADSATLHATLLRLKVLQKNSPSIRHVNFVINLSDDVRGKMRETSLGCKMGSPDRRDRGQMKRDAHVGELFAVRTLGEGLRLLQTRSGMRRDELARAVGISAGSMSNYMNGVSAPSAALLWRVAEMLAHSMGSDADSVWSELGSLLSDPIAGEPEQARPRRPRGHPPDRRCRAHDDLHQRLVE